MAGMRPRSPPHSLAEAIGETRLGHQLAMSDSEDLRTTATVAMLPASQPTWDGTIAVEWPLMTNPFLLSESLEPTAYGERDVRQVAFYQESLPPPPGLPTTN